MDTHLVSLERWGYYLCSLAGQTLLLKERERESGEQSYTCLSLWNAITMIECDIFGHKVCIYVAQFVHNMWVDIACVSLLLRLCTIHVHRGEDRNSQLYLFRSAAK